VERSRSLVVVDLTQIASSMKVHEQERQRFKVIADLEGKGRVEWKEERGIKRERKEHPWYHL
jgi:hypothetical protein